MTLKRSTPESAGEALPDETLGVTELTILGEAVSILERLRDHRMTRGETASAADLAVVAIRHLLESFT